MRIRIEGSDLPGRTCGPGPDVPDGHHDVHVAVQGKKGQHDLWGLVPADVDLATWELDGDVLAPPPVFDVRGPQINGAPGRRFIYLTWGVVGADGTFTMFRRAKLQLDAVPETGHEFIQIFVLGPLPGPFQLHPEEISEGRWVVPGELDTLLAQHPETVAGALRLLWSRHRAEILAAR